MHMAGIPTHPLTNVLCAGGPVPRRHGSLPQVFAFQIATGLLRFRHACGHADVLICMHHTRYILTRLGQGVLGYHCAVEICHWVFISARAYDMRCYALCFIVCPLLVYASLQLHRKLGNAEKEYNRLLAQFGEPVSSRLSCMTVNLSLIHI